MKKKGYILFLLLFAVILTGCQKEKEQMELLPASKEHFYYEGTEGVSHLAVDENGLLYTLKYIPPETTGPIVVEEGMDPLQAYQEISLYDLEGKLIKSNTLVVGNWIKCVTLKDEVLYCVAGKSMHDYDELVLFAVDTGTWTVTTITELKGFNDNGITCMALLGSYVYILGEGKEERLEASVVETLDDSAYQYRNYKICRFDITAENPVSEQMKIEFPMQLYRTEQNTLMIYRYSQETGCGFLEFDPEKITLTERGWQETKYFLSRLSGCGEGYLHCMMRGGNLQHYLCYGTLEEELAILLPNEVFLTTPAVYQKGFAFFINKNGEERVERICIENVVQKDNTLQMLMVEMTQDLPFGCGFLMEEQVLDAEAFALKVLARDSDFDLFLLSSEETVSHNIKENGGFYPLNDVEGVQEYLDACFPYVKELAMDTEGNIWMIPVQPAVTGLIYSKGLCKENDVNYAEMDWMEFFDFTAKVKEENEELAEVSLFVLIEQFFGQYLSRYNSFDTEEFRTYAKQLREIKQRKETWIFSHKPREQIEAGEVPELFYQYTVYSRDVERYHEVLGESDAVGIAGVPKISEGIGNVGTITFLAVNPEAENLKTTLEYISSFAKYMVTKRDSYILADESMYTDAPIVREAYDLYANADIYFDIDIEVYRHDFTNYLNGEMELEEMVAEIERKYQLYIGE